MKALARLLFDALCAMSLLFVVGTLAGTEQPQPGNPADAIARAGATTTPVVELPAPIPGPRRDPSMPPQVEVAAKEPTPSVPEVRKEPVGVAERDIPRVGYSPPPPEPAPPETPPPAREPGPQTISPPYEREPEPIRPQCTPTRAVIMQYWRMDLIRARSLARHANDAQVRRVLGATYKPLMNAVQRGAIGGNNMPEPPESYAQVIIDRHNLGGCRNGTCPTAGSGFDPLPGERP